MKLLPITAIAFASLVTQAGAFTNITPQEAYDLLNMEESAVLLDVRTPEEYAWVGHPGKNKLGEGTEIAPQVINIAWEIEKPGAGYELIKNNLFIGSLAKLNFVADQPVITMCRSGSRSVDAATALEEIGYTNVYNLVGGFEGGTDAKGYRTKAAGWKNLGFPYTFGYTEGIDEHIPGN